MTKKVVVLASNDKLESVYPPLNIAVGAANSGANVILALTRRGINILDKKYIPTPSNGIEYLSNALTEFNAPSISELIEHARDAGVRFYVADLDTNDQVERLYQADQVSIKWILNEAASSDLFIHF